MCFAKEKFQFEANNFSFSFFPEVQIAANSSRDFRWENCIIFLFKIPAELSWVREFNSFVNMPLLTVKVLECFAYFIDELGRVRLL